MSNSSLRLSAACLSAFLCLPAVFAAAQTPAPAMKLAADQQALKDASAIADPAARIVAYEKFLKDFPESKRSDSAREKLLVTLANHHPERLDEIKELGKALVDHAGKGSARWNEENTVAYDLAEAPPNGVDLADAEVWGRDATSQTLEGYTADMKESSTKYKFPLPSTAELQKGYGASQSANLQTYADVLYREGKFKEASAVLDEAVKLDATNGSDYQTRGQIAAAQHDEADALKNFELAALYGGLTAETVPQFKALYIKTHGGSDAGFEAAMDARYKEFFPPPFTPTPRTSSSSGRTVLMELFTGAGCHPCASADLATDGVLRSYPRDEVITLSFDQHIPLPDPLANADSIARADFYGVRFTPTAYLDGQLMKTEMGGSSRDDSKKTYGELLGEIDKELAKPSGVELQLSASLTAAHTVETKASVMLKDEAALRKLLTAEPEKKTAAKSAKKSKEKAKPASVVEPKLVLNFALVQREVSYSGENGVRFHSMLVRAVAKPSAEGFAVTNSGASNATYTFDPAAISKTLTDYLAAFAKHSDRFGETKFLSTDTTIPLDDLAVVAWVEDVTTHHVVQAAYAPVTGATLEASK